MNKDELARELARKARMPAAAAQDQIDELVHRIVKKLRRGQRVVLPEARKLVVRAGRSGRR